MDPIQLQKTFFWTDIEIYISFNPIIKYFTSYKKKFVDNICRLSLKKSRIRDTPTLPTDADSRTNTILERMRNLSLYKKKLPPAPLPRRGAFRGGGHPEHIPVFRALLETTDPHRKADLVHAKMQTWPTLRWGLGSCKMLTRFTLEPIPVLRALLEIEIEVLRLRSRWNSGTHPCF